MKLGRSILIRIDRIKTSANFRHWQYDFVLLNSRLESKNKLLGELIMKIAAIIVRVLMGLMFLFASITYLFKLITPPPMQGAMATFNAGLEASIYIMPVVKVIELLCGLAFVSGKFVRLAVVVIFPIIVNIVCVHLFLDRSGLPVVIPLALCNLFLAYYYRDSYKPILQP